MIAKMKVSQKFCVILGSDGKVYSIGRSDRGALGIRGLTDSKKKAWLITLPGSVSDIEVGD